MEVRERSVILGIDPGLNRTGWGVLSRERGGTALKGCGLIQTPKGGIPSKLAYLSAELSKVFDYFVPQKIALEKIFVSKNPVASLSLAYGRSIPLVLAGSREVPLYEYEALVVKKAVTGQGQASKEQVDFMVRQWLPQIPSGEAYDITDACAVALCCGLYEP